MNSHTHASGRSWNCRIDWIDQRSQRGLRLWLIASAVFLFIASLAVVMTAPLRAARPRLLGQRVVDASVLNPIVASQPYRVVATIAPDRLNPITQNLASIMDQVEVAMPDMRPESNHRVEFPRVIANKLLAATFRRRVGDTRWGALLASGSATVFAVAQFLMDTHPLAAIVLHVVVFFALILVSGTSASRSIHRFALALALVPLTQIVSLGIPTGDLNISVSYVVVAVPLFASSLAVVRALALTPAEIHLRVPRLPAILPSVAIILSGIGIGIVEYVVLRPTAMSSTATPRLLLLTVFVLVIPTAFLEEFIFRGVLQTGVRSIMGRDTAILYGAIVYGLLHLGQAPPLHVAYLTVVGIVFGWFVVWTDSLYPVAIAHGLANVMLFIVLPLYFG